MKRREYGRYNYAAAVLIGQNPGAYVTKFRYHLWCSSLCRPTKSQLGRSVFAGFLIPSVEMLLLMQGTFPLKHFCWNSKLTEILFLHVLKLAHYHIWQFKHVHNLLTWSLVEYFCQFACLKNIVQKGRTHGNWPVHLLQFIWLDLGLRYAISKINLRLNQIGGCTKKVVS